ncbi:MULTISPECIES: hypothetical protein [Methylobacterium]|uniref:hypothetical protein n=1 Tax=Methylobacterium TaxID=407 RepID=UPI0013EA12E4|nr:hypothetical protein [Methylobacterium sp. DB0501]NGM33894.1 hypothetical protein [Methylobacterium sp. DB0501]
MATSYPEASCVPSECRLSIAKFNQRSNIAMMHMFFGDSHSRQFVGTSWGIFCHYVFSGATIKGLGNKNSTTGHNEIIIDAVSARAPKTLFFMFGSVDLDFTYVKMCHSKSIDKENFIEERIKIYSEFLQNVIKTGKNIDNIFILGPQLSPLKGENFFRQSYKHVEIAEEEIRKTAALYPLSDHDRSSLVVEFNDKLEVNLKEELNIRMLRIDKAMMGEDGLIRDEFIPDDISDHHARTDKTQAIWRTIINEHVKIHTITG